jgi:hypothetical protein
MGASYEKYLQIFSKAAADDGDDDAGGGDTQHITNQHPVIAAARLLVASGRFGDHGQALDFLLNKPGGRALLARLKAADPQPAKESTMDSLTAIMKSTGIAATCAAIVQKGSTAISEEEIVSAVTKIAAERYENMSPAQAFAKIYTASGDEARVLHKAIEIAKLSAFDVKPIEVGFEDAYTTSELTAAVRASEEIVRIGREKFPFLSAAQQYARVFEDSNYAALAAQVHRRPSPTTIYQMPVSTAPGRTAYTKSDPALGTDKAFDELMVKAAELRKTQPNLTEAQAFSAIYTDRGNIELAKRERAESAPR